ncbi:oligoendopeptidase F, partial [Bacillus sp. ZZQ-131]
MTELKDRLQVADIEKWDLTDIYHTIEDWESDFHKIEVLTKELHEFNGNIHDGNSLLAYLTKSEEISSIISLMFAYARLQSDLDTRDTDAQSLVDKVSQLHV